MRTPDSLAEQLQRQGMTAVSCQKRPLWCQELHCAAYDAYEAVTGEDFPFPEAPAAPGNYVPPGPAGEQWDFEDTELMRHRLPRLWAWFIRSVSQQPGTAMDQDPGGPTKRS